MIACSTIAQAASDEAANQFQAGREAFEAQDYASALAAFEASLASGQSGPAIHFNIGVAAFKLGRYSRAEAAFKEVARTPEMAALAHYNLGLVAVRQADTNAAARWFARAQQEARDERLRDLAATQLFRLPVEVTDEDWIWYSALGVGYDDNVALVSNSDVLGVSGTQDGFVEGQFAFGIPVGRPWRLDASVLSIDYFDLDRFDQQNVQLGGRYRFEAGRWTNDFGLQLAYTTLDGKGFEDARMLVVQTSTEVRPNWHVQARYRFSDLHGRNDFTGLTGQRHETGIHLAWERGPWDASFGYQFDIDRHDDPELSSNRHDLDFDLRRTLPARWAFGVEVTRRHTRYDLRDNGTEDWTEFGLSATKTLTAHWRLIFRYAYADNASDLAEFGYERARAFAGVEAM